MKVPHLLLLATVFVSSLAFGQAQQRMRGTITAVSGDTLSFKTREGEDYKLEMDSKVSVGAMKKIELADIKPGSFIGTSAVKGPDGKLLAREVHVLPPGTNPGHRPWDLEKGSTMTNANVSSVAPSVNGRVLTLTYEGGTQEVLVPADVPVVEGIPAARSDLVPGAYAVLTLTQGNGKMIVQRIQVTKNGVRPPQ